VGLGEKLASGFGKMRPAGVKGNRMESEEVV
jgi:hypothetical protein